MKLIKGIIGLLILNFASWLFYGYQKVPEIAVNDFQIQTQTFADTIHIYIEPTEWELENIPWYYDSFDEFSNRNIVKMKKKL